MLPIVSSNATLENNLAIYRKVLAQEFIAEFNYLAQVAAGRAQPTKGDFTDNLFSIIKFFGLNTVDSLSLPGVNYVTGALEIALDWANHQRKEGIFAFISQQQLESNQEKLSILLECVAFKACWSYELLIATRLSEQPMEAIIPFARKGAERMLEYIIRQRLSLTQENLLRGLIEGHSGAYITDEFKNTRLASKDPNDKTALTAEGAYGRAGLITGTHLAPQFWILADKKRAKHRQPANISSTTSLLSQFKGKFNQEKFLNYGYSKLEKTTTSNAIQKPKYGYVWTTPIEVSRLGYELQPHNSVSPSTLDAITNNPPTIQAVTLSDIKNYLPALANQPGLAFATFMREQNPHLLWTYFIPEDAQDYDLTQFNFNGADLSHSIWNGCRFGGDLSRTKFCDSYLVEADLTQVTCATDADFTGARLQGVNATMANLAGANFNQAQLQYSNCSGANLQHIQALGTIWIGAELSGTQLDNLAEIERTQQQQTIELQQQKSQLNKLQSQQNDLSTTIANLSIRLEEHIAKLDEKNQDYTLLIAQINKLQKIVSVLQQQQLTRAVFERYCQTELVNLQERTKPISDNNNKTDTTDQQIQQLEKQLIELQKSTSSSTELIDNLEKSVKELEANRTLQESKFQQLQAAITAYQKKQNQIDTKLTQLEHRLKQIEQSRSLSEEELALLAEQALTKLKQHYQQHNQIHQIFGPLLPVKDCYINLSIITVNEEKPITADDANNNAAESFEKKPAYQDEQLRSCKDLFGEKSIIQIEEILKPEKQRNKRPPRFTLVEGNAGIGKTTFITQVCNLWSNGLWEASTLKWVFKITLRNLIQDNFYQYPHKVYQLQDIVYHECFGHLSYSQFEQLWQNVIDPLPNAEKLLVIDGYDEAAVISSNESHPLYRALQELLLGNIPVLLTSRPYSIHGLPSDRRNLEIIGFANEDIKIYVQQFFQSLGQGKSNLLQERGEQLLEFLHNHPSLWETARIPITLNLICGIYQDINQPFVRDMTMTQLYQGIEKKLLEVAYQKNPHHPSLRDMTSNEMEEALRTEYASAIAFLERLAFRGLQQSKLILLPEDLEQALADVLEKNANTQQRIRLFKTVLQLGFIRPTVTNTTADRAKPHEYFHLTGQEYFTARNIASGLRSKDHQRFEETVYFIINYKFDPRYQVVWWFVAGLLREDTETLPIYLELLQDPHTADRIGDYKLGLLARCYEEAYSPSTAQLLQPLLEEFIEIIKSVHDKTLNPASLLRNPITHFFVYLRKNSQLQKLVEQQLDPLLIKCHEDLSNHDLNIVIGTTEFLRIISYGIPKILTKNLKSENSITDQNVTKAAEAPSERDFQSKILLALMSNLGCANIHIANSTIRLIHDLFDKTVTSEMSQVLIENLTDEKLAVRYCTTQAIEYLGEKIIGPKVLQTLSSNMIHPNLSITHATYRAIEKLSVKTIPYEITQALVTNLTHKNIETRINANRLIKRLRAFTPEILQALLENLKHEDETIREDTIITIGRLGEKAAIPEVMAILTTNLIPENSNTSLHIAEALVMLGEKISAPQILHILMTNLRHKDERVRERTIHIIRNLGEKAATREVMVTLVANLVQENSKTCWHIAEALGELSEKASFTPEIPESLMTKLTSNNLSFRLCIALAIINLCEKNIPSKVLQILATSITHKNAKFRSLTAWVIGQITRSTIAPEILMLLVKNLTDKDHNVRYNTILAIQKLGEKAAIPEILEAFATTLTDENETVRLHSTQTIKNLGEKAAIPKILEALTTNLTDENDNIRFYSIWAISMLGEKAATSEILGKLVANLSAQKRLFVDKIILTLDQLKYCIFPLLANHPCNENFIAVLFAWIIALHTSHSTMQLTYHQGNYFVTCWIQQTQQKYPLSPAQTQVILHLLPTIMAMIDGQTELNLEQLRQAFHQLPPIHEDKLLLDLQPTSPVLRNILEKHKRDNIAYQVHTRASFATPAIPKTNTWLPPPSVPQEFSQRTQSLSANLQTWSVLPDLTINGSTLIISLNTNAVTEADAEQWLQQLRETIIQSWPKGINPDSFKLDHDEFDHSLTITLKTSNAAKTLMTVLSNTPLFQLSPVAESTMAEVGQLN